PGITHWQSPNFFAYFPANASPAAVLGDLVSAGLGVQGMLWATSPACTELETHVLDWLVDMLGLPVRFKSSGSGGGVIQDTASTRSPRSLRFAAVRACGCTWMPPTPGAPRSAPSSAGFTRVWSTPTATASIPTSGCSRTSTATASMSPTAGV